MKKPSRISQLSLLIFLFIVTVACVPREGSDLNDAALPETTQAAAIAVDEVKTSSASVETMTPANTPAENSAPDDTELSTDVPLGTSASTASGSLRLNDAAASGPLSETLPIEVTVREFDWNKADAKGDYETRYSLETVDFSDLRISLDELFADETHTRLKLHIRHPEAWTELVSRNMNGWFLHVAVLLDGEQAPFVLKAKSVQLGFDTQNERCDDYRIVLESDEINMHTLAAHRELTVLPFVLTHRWKANADYRYWHSDANGNAVATTLTRPHNLLGLRRTDLDALALHVDLETVCAGIAPQPPAVREPVLRTATLFYEDIQRMLDEDLYLKDGELPWYGYYQNETFDFSGLRIFVEQAEVTDLNILLMYRIELPEEWTPEQVWYLGHYALDFHLLIDGQPSDGKAFSGIRDFTFTSYPALHTIPTSADDPQNCTVRTITRYIFASRQYADYLLDAQELCIVPYVRHDITLRVNGKTYDLDREPSPYSDGLHDELLDWSTEPIMELAVYIDPSALIISKEVD